MAERNVTIEPAGWLAAAGPLSAAISALLAALGLLGWVRSSDLLKSFNQPVAMSPVSAICLIGVAVGLWLHFRCNGSRGARWTVRLFASAVLLVSGLKLLSIFTHFDLKIDTLLFPMKLAGNRIAPNTAGGLWLLSLALLSIDCKTIRGVAISAVLASVTAIVAVLAIVGYGYSITSLFVVGSYIPMALNTAIGLLFLACGVFVARPEAQPAAAVLRNWSHEKVMIAGFTMALVMLCLIGGVAYHSTAEVIAGNILDDGSLAHLEAVSELAAILTDAETGQRGYLLTGDEAYLAPYEEARRRLDQLLENLQTSEYESPSQRLMRQRVDRLIRAKFAELQRTIDLNREQGPDAAIEVVKTGEGKDLMDQLRAILPLSAREERAMLAQRNENEKKAGRQTLATIAIGTVLTFLFVMLATTLVRRGTGGQKRAEQALRESEARFRQLADTVDAVFWLIAADGTELLYLSPRFEEIWGVPCQNLYDSPMSWLETIEPEDRDRVRDAFSNAGVSGRFDADYRMRRPDGQVRYIRSRGFAIRNQEGRIYRLAGIAEDHTERKAVEEDLERATLAAEAANRTKSAFLANMSHEIRTPMTAILGYADMLMAPMISPSDRLDCVQTIRRQGEHLLSILNDVLDISKIEAGKLGVERIPCDPARVLSEAVSLMRVRAIEKKLQLTLIFVGPVPATIQTDPTRLKQILINLLGNAIKFTETGGVQVIVSLENPPMCPSQLRIEVVDSGIGMNSHESAGLFQPFEQADTSTTRRFGGSGLGLSICRRLAQMLGGDISLQSRAGYGSRFTVTVETGNLNGVPLTYVNHEALNDTDSGKGVEDAQPEVAPRMSGRILLAEDGVHNQRVISYYLQSTGATVEVAENGWIACEKAMAAIAAKAPYDLILMDMQMPELDGYSAASVLRSKGWSGPIIAITAHAMSGDRAKCIDAGCTDYLTKPIEKRLLLQIVAKYLTVKSPAEPIEQAETEPKIDPDIAQFLPAFVADLPAQVTRLLELAAQQDIENLRAVLHQLKGTGGMYGLPQVTDVAERAEKQLIETGRLETALKEVESLVAMLRAVDGYDRAREVIHQG